MSLYEALFGCKIKIDLNTSNLPHDVIGTIENKKQLAELITKQSQNVENEVSADTEHITEQPQNIENEASDTEQQLPTTIKSNNENANVMRTRAKENLENQKLLPVAIHSTVRIPVPKVDKGRLDARSDGFYIRNSGWSSEAVICQKSVYQKKLIQIDEFPIDTEVAF
ncbi:SCAN domain-containing protein 3-like [Aphis craccivora]|uniref:SCAN domain-containing protein 3-like n=1 Tax=Aphis craccivora TaxID=307492 RepID=A0A6G0Y3F7_APHCR|nr:SCAN domain-containing protein 3-like [Aphis craccivora]